MLRTSWQKVVRQRVPCFLSFDRSHHILGLETSCDDTGAAIINEKAQVLSENVASQWDIHEQWKGIVPNLAARAHKTNLPIVAERVLKESGLNSFNDLSAIAVTTGPGLAPCLIAGLTVAKAIAEKHNLKLLSINHLEAHLLVPMLTEPNLQFPYLVLLVSGGHCMLAVAEKYGKYRELGGTIDDSVGEAYDKVARMLGFMDDPAFKGMHGGRIVEQVAAAGLDPVHFPEPLVGRKDCDFSFSGLKSAVRRHVEKQTNMDDTEIANIAAGFQVATVKHIIRRTKRAVAEARALPGLENLNQLVVCGGVASNLFIRQNLEASLSPLDLEIKYPLPKYCTDNGTMIAYAGLHKFLAGVPDCKKTVDIRTRWPLQ